MNIKTNQRLAMDILTEDQITGPVARKMRQDMGLTQKAFWNPVGVQQSVACRYELDAGADIPQAVRILIVARYISGLRIAASTPNEVASLSKLGEAQAKQAGFRIHEGFHSANDGRRHHLADVQRSMGKEKRLIL